MFTTKKQFAVIASVIGIVLLFGVVAVNQRYKGLEKGKVQTLSYLEKLNLESTCYIIDKKLSMA